MQYCIHDSNNEANKINRNKYYNEFIDNLTQWCNRFDVFPQKNDIELEKALRSVQYYTFSHLKRPFYASSNS